MSSISVIIPTLNEEKYITTLLSSLQIQTKPAKEIIVVDGYSKDQTRKMVQQFKHVQFLLNSPGVASQRNRGAQKASGNILVFLDADTKVPTNFLQKVDHFFTNNQVSLACPWFIPISKNPFIHFVYFFFDTMFWVFQKMIPSGASTCLIIKNKVFLKSSGFSSEYKFEDIELIRRLSRNHPFQIVPFSVFVSPRRFYQQGIVVTTLQYLLLSFLFCTNQLKLANKVPYFFGKYQND